MTNEYNPDGKEIRFIDSHYKDLFHIPDGSCVQIHYPDEMVVKPCTFIDEYHTQIGYNVFHICQFAEIMERNGASYMPEPEIMGDEAAWKVGKDRIVKRKRSILWFIHTPMRTATSVRSGKPLKRMPKQRKGSCRLNMSRSPEPLFPLLLKPSMIFWMSICQSMV